MYVPQPDWHCHLETSEADINLLLLLIQTWELWVSPWEKTLGTALDAWAWGCVRQNCCQPSHCPMGRGPVPGQTFCAFFLVPTMTCDGCMMLLLDRWGNWSSEGLSKGPEIIQPVESLKVKSTRCKNSVFPSRFSPRLHPKIKTSSNTTNKQMPKYLTADTGVSGGR